MDQATLDKAIALTEEISRVRKMILLASGRDESHDLIVGIRGKSSSPSYLDISGFRHKLPETLMDKIKKDILEHCEQELARLENELASL